MNGSLKKLYPPTILHIDHASRLCTHPVAAVSFVPFFIGFKDEAVPGVFFCSLGLSTLFIGFKDEAVPAVASIS